MVPVSLDTVFHHITVRFLLSFALFTMPPPIDKAKAAGISTSSFHDLKAHLAKQEQELTRKKAAGESTSIAGVARPEKVCCMRCCHSCFDMYMCRLTQESS